MTKRAILIGCNYPGTNAELQGCVNDVWSIKSLLIEIYGFEEDNMVILVDTDDSYTKPTGANIKNAMMEMVGAAEDDDELVIHFSGHGTQLPSPDPDEKDGKDEAICPCDMNIIVDDDMQKIFVPLKEKPTVKFTFIADCCHSGSMLDHEAIQIEGAKEGGPPPPEIDVEAIQEMLAGMGAGPVANGQEGMVNK